MKHLLRVTFVVLSATASAFGGTASIGAFDGPADVLSLDRTDAALSGYDYHDPGLGQETSGQPTFVGSPAWSLDALDSVVSQINADSIMSHVQFLESLPPRVVGTTANTTARAWLMARLAAYGYAPVLDTCAYGSLPVHNIIAYKTGVTCPRNYLVIGAHYDAVPSSPGAGDDGSGVASVLEIARILRDQETHYTFVLSLFDAEEEAVVGSSYMADRFASNGDSVVVMLNMDEIGWNNGTSTTVRLFSGPNQIAAQRFSALAGLLPSVQLNGSYVGSSYYSDHYPFQSCGYSVLFALNYPSAPYRHTSRDSSLYVNPNYVARIARGVMATALDIDDEFKPNLGLAFEYPSGLPDYAAGLTETAFTVRVSGIAGGIPVPGTGQLHYSLDGSTYTAIPMTDLGDGVYTAQMPALGCGSDSVMFYVSAQEVGGASFYDPSPSRARSIPVATSRVTAYADDFEVDKGWSLFEGLWGIGSPVGGGSEFGSPDPTGGRNSSSCLAYNLEGDYEHNLPVRRVKSPAIDCSGLSHVSLRFWRWLGIQFYGYDYAAIAASNDGVNFTNVWSNIQQTAGGYWIEDEVDISAIADNRATVYIEFIMGPTDGGWRYCGWNVDDLEVYGYKCQISCCEGVRGNANGDLQDRVNVSDATYLLSYLFGIPSGPPPPCPVEANANGDSQEKVNVSDVTYLLSYLFGIPSGPPPPACP